MNKYEIEMDDKAYKKSVGVLQIHPMNLLQIGVPRALRLLFFGN